MKFLNYWMLFSIFMNILNGTRATKKVLGKQNCEEQAKGLELNVKEMKIGVINYYTFKL